MTEVDRIGIESESGRVTLSILDDLEWDVGNEHILQLQEKLNLYLGFIESGEMKEAYPDSIDRAVGIRIFFTHWPPTVVAHEFLRRVRETLSGIGISLNAMGSVSGRMVELDLQVE